MGFFMGYYFENLENNPQILKNKTQKLWGFYWLCFYSSIYFCDTTSKIVGHEKTGYTYQHLHCHKHHLHCLYVLLSFDEYSILTGYYCL